LVSTATGERTSRHREHNRNDAHLQHIIACVASRSRFTCKFARLHRFERHASAAPEDRTVGLLAWRAVVNAIAVAAVEAGFSAKPPNCELDKPGEIGREGGIEAARVDFAGDAFDDVRTTARSIAAGAVGVIGTKVAENAGACPLPRHDLRNGRLNQTAYSLFLFMRDIAGGDIVGWIDQRLEAVDLTRAPDRPASLRQALLEPLVMSAAWEQAATGSVPPPAMQAEVRAAASYVTEVAQRVTTVAFQAAGGGALFDTNPLQRCFRDVYAAGQHFMMSQSSFRALGQFKLNQPDANPML
jgi:hypothetical protein